MFIFEKVSNVLGCKQLVFGGKVDVAGNDGTCMLEFLSKSMKNSNGTMKVAGDVTHGPRTFNEVTDFVSNLQE